MVLRKAILVVLVALLCRYLFLFLVKHGVGVHYNEHFPGQCKVLHGITCGSEQIRITKKNEPGLAFITNGQQVLSNCNPDYNPGNIYMFDFKIPNTGVLKLTIESSEPLTLDDFRPHGMDLLENEDGTTDLYTINHAHHVDTVEVFRYNPNHPGKLQHLRTIRDELFMCINDLTILGENQFYITRCLKYCEYPTIIVAFEFFSELETASILNYAQGKSKVVASGPGFNGITQSLDGRQVVVAAGSTTFLHVYTKLQDNELKFKEKIDVGHFPDNVFTDHHTGDFYGGVLKKTLRFFASATNKTKAVSPASGVRVAKTTDGRYLVEEVFHDSGRSFIQCFSTVVHYKGQYLFGSVFHNLLYCNDIQ